MVNGHATRLSRLYCICNAFRDGIFYWNRFQGIDSASLSNLSARYDCYWRRRW